MKEEIIRQMEEVEANHWWFTGRRKIILSALQKQLPEVNKNFKVLDIGCGTGENLKFFSGYFKNITGIESNKTALELAGQKSGVPVVYGKMPDEIPFFEEKFDIVFLLDVLEHIDDDVLSLQKIKELIKPGGHLVMTVPAFEFLWSVHDVLNEHKRRYTIKTLKNKTEKTGYIHVFSNYFNFILFPVIAVFRLIKKKTGILKDKSDIFMPNKIINHFFTKIMEIESFLIKFTKFPAGCSVLLISKNCQSTRN